MSLLYDIDPYNPLDVPGESQSYQDAIKNVSDLAEQPYSVHQDKLNKDIYEKSNLLAASKSQTDPESEALQARAKQMHTSDVNQMTRRSLSPAVDRQAQLQTQDVNNRAARFQNAQTRLQIAYQQASFQRESAMNQEISKRNLYAQLFGGIGFVGAVAAASSMYNTKHKTPLEYRQSSGADLPVYPDRFGRNMTDQFIDRLPGSSGYESLRPMQFNPIGQGDY